MLHVTTMFFHFCKPVTSLSEVLKYMTNHILGFIQYFVLLKLSGPLKGGFKFAKDNSQKTLSDWAGLMHFLSFNLINRKLCFGLFDFFFVKGLTMYSS